MSQGNLKTDGLAGDLTTASSNVPKNNDGTIDSNKSFMQMIPPIATEQQSQATTYTTNPNQSESQEEHKTDNPSIVYMSASIGKQNQHQLHTFHQHNPTGGQASIDISQQPPPHYQQQQQQSQPVQITQQHPQIKPLLGEEPKSDIAVDIVPNQQQSRPDSAQKTITKVKLSDELNIFDWLRTTDIINQIAEKAKSSVDSVITTLDPGMREYLYSGGNINIVVICDNQRLVSSIRDSFQDVFGRATVVPARYNSLNLIIDYPIKIACGFAEAAEVAREKIKKFRSDTSSIPQNQVVIVVQSALVSLRDDNKNVDKPDDDAQSDWFLTYCMLIEDPVLSVTLKSFGELIPLDQDIVDTAKTSRYPDEFQDRHLGFTVSIDELMAGKQRLSLKELAGDEHGCSWLPKWAGIYESQVIRHLSLTLAHSYRRKWNECSSIETVTS